MTDRQTTTPSIKIFTLGDEIGYIEYLGHYGDDLLSVNAARVSFDRYSMIFSDADERLLGTLIKSTPMHSAPLRHAKITFRMCAPVAIARQFYKHVVGIDTIEYDGISIKHVEAAQRAPDEAWNEKSGRYVTFEPEFYIPDENSWRLGAKNNKQGSVPDTEGRLDGANLTAAARAKVLADYEYYKSLLAAGVAKEQARFFLPQSMYVEWYWTLSLQSALHFVDLRDHPGAQGEAQKYGVAMENLLSQTFPAAMRVWNQMRDLRHDKDEAYKRAMANVQP